MTDEELLGYLRRSSVGYTKPLRIAADRIEALVKQCEGLAQAAMNNGQALILAEARAAPDHAAIREAALFEAAAVAESWYRQWAMYSSGNEPTRNDRAGGITYGRLQGADIIAATILALIQKGAADDR